MDINVNVSDILEACTVPPSTQIIKLWAFNVASRAAHKAAIGSAVINALIVPAIRCVLSHDDIPETIVTYAPNEIKVIMRAATTGTHDEMVRSINDVELPWRLKAIALIDAMEAMPSGNDLTISTIIINKIRKEINWLEHATVPDCIPSACVEQVANEMNGELRALISVLKLIEG